MTAVEAHYQNHLAPVYAWMVGGLEAAFEAGAEELDELALAPRAGEFAVDLGAGLGGHAVPLARQGMRVLAIDSSEEMLSSLRQSAVELPLQVVNDDLLNFRSHVPERPRLILCMGDTITHLPSMATLERFMTMVANAIPSGGVFVTTFRDYSKALEGEQRFVHVRSDADRILTCFLEYQSGVVTVHDMLHERAGERWTMRVSAYQKLRVRPDTLIARLRDLGFSVEHQTSGRGMVRLVCTRR
ncbi:MAG: class I SAM-dependent methyltransferase [Hydrogenophaga sp.]|nr:class I SAM-dependent methyltransferase [Hydrogenophaga sp.]